MGGTSATNAEFPWVVKIRGCGAALISAQWVVTAAHCVGSDQTIDVWLGVHRLSDNFNEVSRGMLLANIKWLHFETRETDFVFQYIYRESIQVIRHPGYNSRTQSNDIALIKLPQPLDLNARTDIAPVCLPPSESSESYAGDTAIAIGWGRTSEGGSSSNTLRKVNLPVLSNSACRGSYGNDVRDNMVCAGSFSGGIDTCQGDSGGEQP